MKSVLKIMIAFTSGQLIQILLNLFMQSIGLDAAALLLSTVFGILVSAAMIVGAVILSGSFDMEPAHKKKNCMRKEQKDLAEDLEDYDPIQDELNEFIHAAFEGDADA